MNEQELRQENERLRRELAEANKSRERLREIICAIWPVDPPEVMEQQIKEIMMQPPSGILDLIAKLAADGADVPAYVEK